MKTRWLTWPKLLKIIGTLLVIGALSALLLYVALLADLPPIDTVATRLIRPATQIVDRNGRLLYEVIDPEAGKQLNLDLSDLPQTCIQATIATEDKRFYLHPGVDPVAIVRAVVQNLRGREVVSGGSTLTQQLARNLFLSPEERYTQSLARKIREGWLAWQLERIYTKDQVLALYLNQTYYGNFAFGLEAAAQVFFAKPASQLSKAECTLLAGLVQFPTGYNPLQEPETAKARQLTVLRLMREAGFLDQSASDAIAAEPLRYKSHLFDIRAPHFVMYVQDWLRQQVGVDQLRAGGLRVVTTLDLDLQQQAEAAIHHRLDLLNCRAPGLCDARTDPNRRVDNAAAVILDAHTGEILAMVGSPDYFDGRIQGNVNAALSLRQPGSAIKPLTYALALDPGWNQKLGLTPLTPASIIADLPTVFQVKDEDGVLTPYQPANYDRRFHGPVSLRTALANSYNIPAVKLLDRVGVASLQQLAAQAGISTFGGDFGLALTLGGGEVRLLELTAAFGIFQQGQRLETKSVKGIEGLGDWAIGDAITRVNRPIAQSPDLIAPATAYLITDILSDNAARIPSFGANSVLHLPFAAAAKTGTTTDYRDNWTIGYSTERIVGVWVGNADNAAMLDVSGIDGAGPIWRDLMLAAHPQPPPAFARPPAIVDQTVCAPSGMLPSADCPQTIGEHFIRGTAPTQVDDQFQRIAIDVRTGQRATADTPPNQVIERVYWNLPSEYHDWMLGQGLALIPPVIREMQAVSDTTLAPPSPLTPLILTSPTANAHYRLRADLPAANQRLEISGLAYTGQAWAELRLIKDGAVLATATNVDRLAHWWPLTTGQHRFWLEGRQGDNAPIERSGAVTIRVE